MALGRTVAELRKSISSAEFVDWMAYARTEPFGYPFHIWQSGLVAATIVNVAPRKRGARPLKPSDFYPPQKQSRGLTPRQQKQLAERRAAKRRK